ncbi:hypothetical protein [Thalassotalea sp. G2M2-11]|uniref:hypothetical protein n=1 Tax=Thalassotalea sp. G2M2-11 TaxID=2787627 RepID=UPI0019CF730D|nr:hypothetical protein [Thalassotalea sp. G2M2-11]
MSLLIAGPYSAQAEQIKFSKILKQGDYIFHYQWRDHTRNQHEISFAIPKTDIFNRYRDFSRYQPELAKEYINNQLLKRLQQTPLTGVQLEIKKTNNQLVIDIHADDQEKVQQAYQTLAKLKAEVTQQYLANKYYQLFTTANQIRAVKPDHARIAYDSAVDFKPLKDIILKKASIKNIRKVTNFVLNFVQSIPYAPLASRVTSSGAGFNPPLKLLWENQGDCDSKVTLTAALLRMLMPRIKMALVYTENHALIGIDTLVEQGEQTITYEGSTYILAEPTGPALLTLGNIAPETEQAINSGYYTIEPFDTPYQSNEDDTEDSLDDDNEPSQQPAR